MIITINFESEIPIYTQLHDQIVLGIAKKTLLPNESLPSVRRMAADIGIHAHTVNKAYSSLKDEGFITMDRRSGCYISSEIKKWDELRFTSFEEKVLPLSAEAACRGIGKEEFLKICEKIYEEVIS